MTQGGKPSGMPLVLLVVGALAAGGGYWFGQRPATHASATAAPTAEAATKERKLLYYRNPMGLPDTSPTPKKDPMGMDYVPVYEGEDEKPAGSPNEIRIGAEKVQQLGVKTEVASLRVLDKTVRAAGRIELDERRAHTISPKVEGYIERLLVNSTGQAVSKGQALFEVYSPELVSAQREYVIAVNGVQAVKDASAEVQASMRQLADASLARLGNWDISQEQIDALAKSGDIRRTLTFFSPVSGIVTEKKAVQGMRFMPGDVLYQVSDLTAVWVVADVFEQDIGLVRSGSRAKITIAAYPGKELTGAITYVYPTLNPETRTVPVRVELANPAALLKPGMFVQVELAVGARRPVLTVPVSAVIDSGTRQIVLVQAMEGRFEPRQVKLGARSDNFVEVLDGVRNGEMVVVSANFLIDAESNLKAAVAGFGQATPGGAGPSTPAMSSDKSSGPGHKAQGTVKELDIKAGTARIAHGAVPSLQWPAMSMEFKLANDALRGNLQPGADIAFEFVERAPGEWVITSVKPIAKAAAAGQRSGN